MCLNYKLSFIVGMYVCIGKNIVFGSIHSFRHPLEGLGMYPLQIREGWHSALPRPFSACQLSLQILDLPGFVITRADSVKSISLSLYIPLGLFHWRTLINTVVFEWFPKTFRGESIFMICILFRKSFPPFAHEDSPLHFLV